MVNSALLETLELLTPEEQKALLAVAEYLKTRRAEGVDPGQISQAVVAELGSDEPRFATPDDSLSSARKAARRFMRENPALMRLLAQ